MPRTHRLKCEAAQRAQVWCGQQRQQHGIERVFQIKEERGEAERKERAATHNATEECKER